MKAMIYAAGLGTRLRPLTDDRPKALVEVNGMTMLERVARALISHGVDEIVINIHHFGEKIIDFLQAKDNFGITVHISDERDVLLDTGGGLLHAREFFSQDNAPFFVHNADILTTLDYSAMLREHNRRGCDVTLLVKHRQTQRYLLFDKLTGSLSGWVNKQTLQTRPEGIAYAPGKYNEYAFGGVHILTPDIFSRLQHYSEEIGSAVFSITPFYLRESVCSSPLRVYGYDAPTPYEWFDIGKPETLALAQKALL